MQYGSLVECAVTVVEGALFASSILKSSSMISTFLMTTSLQKEKQFPGVGLEHDSKTVSLSSPSRHHEYSTMDITTANSSFTNVIPTTATALP